QIAEVPCHGLADAVERAQEHDIDVAVAAAAELTPRGVRSVVLGCTHYELVGERIRTAVSLPQRPLPVLFRSADAVAAQALRRIGAEPDPLAACTGGLTVLLSGRTARLPEAAGTYAEGRLLTAATLTR
ncbi:MAG TPA: glutamate racemase, partial [Streptomyces sp.]|nr:glutamate racemase [Streptomyces sp.]